MSRPCGAVAVAALSTSALLAPLVGVQLAVASPSPHRTSHHPVKAIAPLKAAWYDESRPTTSTPAAPMPGVGKGDLVISGTTINVAQLPLPLPTSIPVLQHVTAFTALAFRIPKGATPATLTLNLTGFSTSAITSKLPSGVTPVACPTTSAWKAGGQQSIAAAPKYDCKSRSSVGQLKRDGKAIVFPGINRLIRGRTLSFVVLPGTIGLDRMVFTKPDAKSLGLLRFSTPPVSVPPIAAQPTPSPVATQPATVVPPGQPGSVEVPVPSGPGTGSVPAPISSPQVAATTTTALPASVVKPLDDHRARIAAAALLVALVVTTLWLAVTDSSGRALTTLRVLGALSSGGPLPDLPAKEWGVGRFRAPRDGRPPTI